MKYLSLFPALALFLFSCQSPDSQEEESAPAATDLEMTAPATVGSLALSWEVQGMKTPESVCYDPEQQMLYVANINGNADEADGNGFISRISLAGEQPEPTIEWVSGLDAPKGMAVYKDRLYVSDITQVVEIDRNQGTVLNRFPAPEAVFLNDVEVDASGTVYVSDTRSDAIYRMEDGRLVRWLEGGPLVRPNGLALREQDLLVGVSSRILAVSLADGSMTSFADSTELGNITDGLVSDGQGGYFTSNWAGGTWHISPQGQFQKVLDTSAENINSADITFIPERSELVIPTFLDNRVMAYTWQPQPDGP